MDGFVNILKPTGMTSHDVVKVLRRLLGEKKTGHTGTLDPMAIGVLPVGLGSATKVTEYLDGDFKKYRCELVLGLRTDTGDIWGNVLSEEKDYPIDEAAIYGFEKTYKGEILQTPPMYSAVRVDGKRLYEYARNGETVKVKSRKITINDLKIVRIDRNRILFDVECSKGTYVRTICTEMGEALGMCAAMSFLARTGSGAFTINDAVTFEEIQNLVDEGRPVSEILKPVDFPIKDFPLAILKEKQGQIFANGGHIKLLKIDFPEGRGADESDAVSSGYFSGYLALGENNINLRQYYRVFSGGVFIGIGYVNKETDRLVPHKVFAR